MANITGTEGNDTLRGTAVDDTIKGLGGDDLIIGSTGRDTVDGGVGNDKLDFTGTNKDIILSPYYQSLNVISGKYQPETFTSGVNFVDNSGVSINTDLNNVETIIGNPNQRNTLFYRSSSPSYGVDLSTNQIFTGNGDAVNIKNFDNITLDFSSGSFTGNDRNNTLIARNSSFVIFSGSKGNDTLDFGRYNQPNNIYYGNVDTAVKVSIKPKIEITTAFGGTYLNYTTGTVDKGSFGKDTVIGFTSIQGNSNKENTLDLSSAADTSSGVNVSDINVNLAQNIYNQDNNSLVINYVNNTSTPAISPLSVKVIGFTNVIGSKGKDTIVGADVNSKLTGGSGNDTITGGIGNDLITGTDSTARGVSEVDMLTGGGGRDKFILGDKGNAYYVGNGNNDYATITDFDLFKDSINLGGFKNYSFALEGNNTIDLYSGKDVKTRDLIAKIQISGGISTVASNSRSIAGASPNLDAIIAKIDIVPGSNS
jgi:Ca2+-binding RTX toxin-like protein